MREQALALIAGDARGVVNHPLSATDWAELLALAGEQLHPWLAWRMADLQLMSALPAATADILRQAHRASAVAALRRGALFAASIRALDAAGIPVVVLKGLALAYLAYPDPTARPMADIDLWIEPHRQSDAWRCLADVGWRVPDRYRVFGLGPSSPVWTLQFPDTATLMEVHAIPDSISAVPSDDWPLVWRRCVPQQVAGVTVRVLATEDQITHLAIHLVRKHAFASGLRSLLDLSRIAGTLNRQDWWTIGTAHRSQGVAPWTSVTLDLARRLLSAPVPDEYFAAAMVGPTPPEMVAAASDQLWDREYRLDTGVERVIALSSRSTGATLWSHVRAYFAAPPAPGQSRIGSIVGRASWNLTSRLPRYATLLMRGELSPARRAYRARRLREREALRRAVAALASPAIPATDPAPPPSSH